MRTRRRRRVLALGMSLLLAGIAAELAVRAILGAPLAERLPILRVQANPHRGWEMVPGEAHYTYRHRVQVNAHGLRGAEIGAEVAGERRVLCLGDSLIYGQGVGDDETVPALLEAALAGRVAPGGTWRAINGGLRAYGTNQELGLLEELGGTLSPDVVVLFWFWNDLVERSIPETDERLRASGPIAFDTNEVMEGWPLVRWRAQEVLRRSALVMFTWDQLRARRAFLTHDAQDAGIARLAGHLARFRELCTKIGAEPIVAVIPDSASLLRPHPTRAISLQALAVARGEGVPVVDLLPCLAELAREHPPQLTIPFDGHYTPCANRAMAEAIAEATP